MRQFLETWSAPLALVGAIMLAFFPLVLGSCEHAEKIDHLIKQLDVAVCYVHPEYGKVCVEYDGKVHLRFDIANDPLKLSEVGEWLKDKLPPGVTLEPSSKTPAPASSGTDPPK